MRPGCSDECRTGRRLDRQMVTRSGPPGRVHRWRRTGGRTATGGHLCRDHECRKQNPPARLNACTVQASSNPCPRFHHVTRTCIVLHEPLEHAEPHSCRVAFNLRSSAFVCRLSVSDSANPRGNRRPTDTSTPSAHDCPADFGSTRAKSGGLAMHVSCQRRRRGTAAGFGPHSRSPAATARALPRRYRNKRAALFEVHRAASLAPREYRLIYRRCPRRRRRPLAPAPAATRTGRGVRRTRGGRASRTPTAVPGTNRWWRAARGGHLPTPRSRRSGSCLPRRRRNASVSHHGCPAP